MKTDRLDPILALWHSVNDMNSIAHRIGWVPAYWFEEDGVIEHRVGPMYNYLYFD